MATLLIAVSAICLCLGTAVERAHKQRRAVETIARLEGGVMFDYEFEPHGDLAGDFKVGQIPPGPAWAQKLIGDDYFRTVIGLAIDGHGQAFDPADWSAICGLRELKLIVVRNAALTDADLERICTLRKLEVLNLISVPLTDTGVQTITQARRLESLTLARTRVTDAGLSPLAQLTSLARLDLSGSQINGSGLAWLGELPLLEELSLAETMIDDRGLPHLQRLRQLKQLDLWRTNFSDAAAKQLSASLPNCGIIWSR